MGARLLVYGGTFDPPHRAHIELPRLAAARLQCDRVLYVPAQLNPHKTDDPPTDARHRMAMLRLAIAHEPWAAIETIELERAGPSYTVETLEVLCRRLGDAVAMRLLIGSDQALAFHRWRSWRRVVELAEPAVLLRPPHDPASFARDLRERYDEHEASTWLRRMLDLPVMDVNATELRCRLARGERPAGEIPEPVLDYIVAHGLYVDP